ncbi:MAG: hypothetical protein JWL66_2561 [Sphingomonadales bacterium]|nr:hypothetical protein [Sphingomonadales bacterium]
MAGIKWIAILIIIIMSGYAAPILLHDSLDHGAGLDVFLTGSKHPWQAFINQDLVSGLLLALAWLVYRQKGSRMIDTVAWIWMVLWWGNIVVAAYVLLALRQSEGDRDRFFLGSRAGPLLRWQAPGMAVRIVLLALAALTLVYLADLIRSGPMDAVSIAGALLGISPVTLSLVLLAFPAAPVDVAHRPPSTI